MSLSKWVLAIGLLVLGLLSIGPSILHQGPDDPATKRDDWVYSGGASNDWLQSSGSAPTGSVPMYRMQSQAEASRLGFAAGGAKGIDNLRENVANGYLPLPTDLTYEGLFYEYYFDTGEQIPCERLFCPSYSHAVSRDPISGEPEHYLTVGLNSGLTEADFERKTLNLVVVLDISGSMSSPFDRYYYDRSGQRQEVEPSEDAEVSKMALAAESVAALMDHLKADDRFGVVLFNGTAHRAKPLSRVGDTDMDAIRDHVLQLRAGGSTNMSAGLQMGTNLFDELPPLNPSTHENRIILLTEAMPNRGATDDSDLLSLTERNAERGIHSTFIGIGVDFNTELADAITTVRGANYHAVHSAAQFRERMDGGFPYMVTPLVFDLELTLEAPGYRIAQVYGSPEADASSGRLMTVDTLFPSRTKDGETKGGVVLLKLERLPSDETTATAAGNGVVLQVRYADRNGGTSEVETRIALDARAPEHFDNTGIRKAILLARYADLIGNWLNDERRSRVENRPIEPSVNAEAGIHPPERLPELGRWERQSIPLNVSSEYRSLFQAFADHLRPEMRAIGDETLQRELDLLATLASP